jgi:hypothetical protein
VGLAVLVSAGAEMRRSGLDGCTQPHHTKATERKQRKVHKPGKLRRRRRFASSVASTAVETGKRRSLGRKFILKSVFFLLRCVCLCALVGSFLTYLEELWCWTAPISETNNRTVSRKKDDVDDLLDGLVASV